MARFEAVTSVEGHRAAVALSGECDLSAREECTAALLAAVETSPQVVVDLGGLTFLDSSGVHALVTAFRAAQDRGRRLSVVGAAGMVAHVLEITGVGGLLSPRGDADADGARNG
ncbi:STAS domain-containing protein [Dactylosporangium sp. CA-139114]|uniref:STAS domain-containing protein n=1 Tax=Dactylosporangium sp. CA-139114 TaxID=3239931 RepID=UPI003D97B3A4